MQDIYVKLAKMKIALEKKLTHPYLEKYIPSPKIDEDKLLLFYAIFDEINLSEDLKESYIITAMLVQIALDTHDNVTTNNDINSTEFVQRQLIVLAGDYFSGLYYYMLSEVQDINMVRILAVAIKEINEHKIRLYHDNANNQSIMESLVQIETVLYQRVSDHLKLDPWKLLSTNFLTYKRLSHEKFRYEDELKIHDKPKYKPPFSTNDINIACNEFFEATSSLLESSFFKTHPFKKILYKRLQTIRFHETLHDKKTVEEGL